MSTKSTADAPLDSPARMTFDGESTALHHTRVAGTLDTELRRGTSVIWCASFILAWRRLTMAAGHPVEVAGAEGLCESLNAADDLARDMPEGSCIAVAGRGLEAVRTVHSEIERLFPGMAKPELDMPPDGWLAYAYLEARVPFPIPYFESREPLAFVDGRGRSNPVRAFGFLDPPPDPPEELMAQGESWLSKDSVALDLCRASMPTQIVVACLEPQGTLGATCEAVEELMRRGRRVGFLLGALRVPNLFWRVRHAFRELSSGPVLSPPGIQRLSAIQEIRFRLDRSGAELRSHAELKLLAGANLRVNRPFLIYMKKRGAKLPMFAMWVDNAELLVPWTAE